ncbi:ABC transporter transmembrane domain-containing protein [Neptuniibacter sp. PT34_22]|uniref:ABC transporter transmembrane domain-containing protein n=1 Tax=Neptuniibacter sp. PT34_22 TaxID=3398205 RepID=UPI0039F5D94C
MLPPMLSKQRWKGLGGLILIGLIQTACFLGLMTLAKDQLGHEQFSFDIAITSIVLAAILGLAAARYCERYFAERIAQAYICELRNTVYKHTLALPVSDEALSRGGTLLRLTGDMTPIRNWMVHGIAPLLVLGIWLLAAFVALSQIHWTLLVTAFIPLAFAVLGNFYLGKGLYRSTVSVRRERGRLINATNERLALFKLIRLFNQSGKEQRKFSRSADRLKTRQMRKAHASSLIRGFNEAVLLISVLVIVMQGLNLSQAGLIAETYIPVLLVASLYLVNQLRRLSRLYELWTLKKVSEDKLGAFLERDIVGLQSKRRLPKRAFKVELKRMAVKQRFSPISCVINEQDRLLLRGAQGAGKSSFMEALAGIVPITSGKLRFCGRRNSLIHPSIWAQTVSLVSPELPLLKGTLSSNLFYGARKRSEEFTQEVIETTGLQAYCSDKGSELKIEERGSNLPSNLRFRVQLARALLRRPKLLLIDSDVALKSPDIRSMLVVVYNRFDGAIVIAEELEELMPLTNGDIKVSASGDAKPSNVVEFPRGINHELA